MTSTTAAANDSLVESWRLSLHDKAPRTITLYVAEVGRFADWLEDHDRPEGSPGDLLGVGRRDVETWIADLQNLGRSKSTIRSRWIALRNFYGWLADEDEIDVSPLAKVTVPKPEPPPPDVVGADELRALLKVCDGRRFEDRRDAALIRFMVATGLRVSETCSLAVADVDLRTRVAHVRSGKGDRARAVRFDAATASAVDRYKRARARHRLASLPALWIGHRGPLTRKGVPAILDRRSQQAGIGHVHPHQLRHTWAHRWLAAGGQEGDLQHLGGWTSAEVMRRYGSAQATDRALAAYDTVDPLGDL